MQYYRCKCGQRQMQTSMGSPKDCQGCSECNTTYAQYPDDHKPLEPHDYSVTMYDQNTGKPFKLCSKCNQAEPESRAESKNP